MEELVERIAETAIRERLWRKGDTVVVAVSGGPDSMALLHILHRLSEEAQLTLVAAHANHGFRPGESASEAEKVASFCAGLGIPLETAKLDIPSYMEETKLNNAQLAARVKRYAFLHKIAGLYGARLIALAHHADDQAETVLMRLLRGTGIGGLAGMALRRHEKNVELIRPLLRITKTDILSYCQAERILYCVDSSNLKRTYLRNAIRLDVLPYLQQFNPQLSHSLVRLAEISAAEDDLLERETLQIFERSVTAVTGGFTMERGVLTGLHIALQRRLIKLILNYLALEMETTSYDRIEEIRAASADHERTAWSADIGSRIRFVREGNKLLWQRSDITCIRSSGGYECLVEQAEELLYVPQTGDRIDFSVLAPEDAAKPVGKGEALFDLDQIRFPLTVRCRRPGDRMAVQGLNGTKKVQDMFVDAKIDSARRDGIPLVWDADGRLLWIPGVRRSAHAQAGPASTRLLRMVFRGSNGTND